MLCPYLNTPKKACETVKGLELITQIKAFRLGLIVAIQIVFIVNIFGFCIFFLCVFFHVQCWSQFCAFM